MSLTKVSYSMINGAPVNVFDFMSAAQIADVVARTSTLDVASAINLAIASAISLGTTVYLPAGTYRIDSPLFVYTSDAFISTSITGELGSGLISKGTRIDNSRILTAPALIVQGARKVIIENLSFWGPCPSFDSIADWSSASSFVQAGVRDSVNSPQAAICVDPFKSTIPSDGGYPTLTAYYTAGARFSSAVIVRNCNFRQQLVGVMLSPAGNEANNENGYIQDCNFSGIKIAIAMGQIQEKGWSFLSIFTDLCFTVIDAYSYGSQNGSAGFIWTGGDSSRTNALIRTTSQTGAANSITQNWSINGVYAEAIYTIGWIGTGPVGSQLPGSFNQCTFWFIPDTVGSTNADAVLTNFAPVTFKDCVFNKMISTNGQVAAPIKFYHATLADQKNCLSFFNCRFSSVTPLFNLEYLQYIRMWDCVGALNYFRANFTENYKLSNIESIDNYSFVWPGSMMSLANDSSLLYLEQNMNTTAIGSVAVTVSTSTATYTAPDVAINLVGDCIYAANESILGINNTTFNAGTFPLGVITTIVGSAITLNGVGVSSASATRTLSLRWYPFMHSPTTVATTSGSTSIALTQTGGNAWGINQRIISTNIPSGSYIVSGTSPNYVISKAATATASGTRAYDANASKITKVAY